MKLNTNFVVLLALALCLLSASAITYLVYTTPSDAPNSDAVRTLSLDGERSLTDLEGNPISLDSYEGRVRVVNLWASWSPFSQQELPVLEQLAQKYAQDGVVVLAINRKEQKEQAQRFLRSIGALDHVVVAIDPTDAFYTMVEGYAMPETVFYDARGAIIFHKRGVLAEEEAKRLIEEALARKR